MQCFEHFEGQMPQIRPLVARLMYDIIFSVFGD